MKKLNRSLLVVMALSIAASGCSRAVIRHNLGVKADAPDEFMVEAKKKPLVIPENIDSLPLPQSAVKKKFESYDPEESRKELFGEEIDSAKSNETSAVEISILEKAETDRVKANIRKTIEIEYKDRSSIFGTAPGGIMESVVDPFGYNRTRPEVVDGKEENRRIRQALSKGKKVDPKKVIVEKEE